jgi:uncharacterized membrane protein YdjX (TVP38/TMEM64 family)
VLLLIVISAMLGKWLRPELELLGREFVDRCGLPGMAAGAFIADGFHFPVPPQFYMMLAVATAGSELGSLTAIAAGSIAGGVAGFFVARFVGRTELLERHAERFRPTFRRLEERHGHTGAVLLAISPLPYSWLCYFAGFYRVGIRVFLIIAGLRIPKLLVYYLFVRLGWHAFGG